jgi:hypothetical protein
MTKLTINICKVPTVVLRLRRQYTLRRWNGEAHQAILKVGCQYFIFATVETKAEVQWYRNQMAHALSVLLSQNAPRQFPARSDGKLDADVGR